MTDHSQQSRYDDLKSLIRDVPDFPKPGILFRDVTPLLQDPLGLVEVVEALADRYFDAELDKIVAVESRGFIFGAPLAMTLGIGFVPVRKAGKLPWTKISEEYVLEYGKDTLEMHADAIKKDEKILIVDDLLATGGTVNAVCNMVNRLGAKVHELAFLVELDFLKGREVLKEHSVFSLLHYS